MHKAKETDTQEELDFDAGAWEEEQELLYRKKLIRYEKSLACLLGYAIEDGEISLLELSKQLEKETEKQTDLLPTVEVFKEIMVELIRNREIDILALKQEQSEYIQEQSREFQLNVMLLNLVEECPKFHCLRRIEVYRLDDGETVTFSAVLDENGEYRTIRCSNVMLCVTKEE